MLGNSLAATLSGVPSPTLAPVVHSVSATGRRTRTSPERCLACGTASDVCVCCLRCTRCHKCAYWAGPIPADETPTLARLREIAGDLHGQQLKAVTARRSVSESKRLKYETRIARVAGWDAVIADYDKRRAENLEQIRALMGTAGVAAAAGGMA